jgi:hypothetical protein
MSLLVRASLAQYSALGKVARAVRVEDETGSRKFLSALEGNHAVEKVYEVSADLARTVGTVLCGVVSTVPILMLS